MFLETGLLVSCNYSSTDYPLEMMQKLNNKKDLDQFLSVQDLCVQILLLLQCLNQQQGLKSMSMRLIYKVKLIKQPSLDNLKIDTSTFGLQAWQTFFIPGKNH